MYAAALSSPQEAENCLVTCYAGEFGTELESQSKNNTLVHENVDKLHMVLKQASVGREQEFDKIWTTETRCLSLHVHRFSTQICLQDWMEDSASVPGL